MKDYLINLALMLLISIGAVSCLQAPDVEDTMPKELSFEAKNITAVSAIVDVKIKSKSPWIRCNIIISTSPDFEGDVDILPHYDQEIEGVQSGDTWTFSFPVKELIPSTTYFYKIYRVNDSGMDGFSENGYKTFTTSAKKTQTLRWAKDYSVVRFGEVLDLSVISDVDGAVPVTYTFSGKMYELGDNKFIPLSVGEVEIKAVEDQSEWAFPATITKKLTIIEGNDQYTLANHIGIYMGVDTSDGGKIYWSPYTLGASGILDNGYYYMWCDTYKFPNCYESNNPTSNLTYDQLLSKGYINKDGVSTIDAAKSLWGNNWRTPTNDEVKALMDACTYRFLNYRWYGDQGGLLTSNVNGNSIYIRAAGYKKNGNKYREHEEGWIWTSTPHPTGTGSYALCVESTGVTIKSCYRFCGFNVLPVVVVYPK